MSLQNIYTQPQILWSQLTELDFFQMALAAMPILKVLKQCGQLKSCHLWVEHGEHRFPTLESIGSEDIKLAHLRLLVVGGKISQGNRFFARLFVPSLADLCLTMEYPHAFADVSAMLRASRTSLKIFQYDSNKATHLPEVLELEDLLKSFPSLVELNSSLKFPSSTLERVFQRELLPRVEVLNCIVGMDELDAFFSMLINRRSRPGSSCGLRKVWITFTEDAKESGEERSQSISDKYGITRV
ncbi:hypothetical protein Hypma_004513 [Hypsizygus marmoreus]|uniref:F-box domain-containing protein n=1 Tax=Hypsizygus marmoreus TaxID=39966 RepID=A0A369JZT5_HYPMA|nr:hypothetical protein Hypma_004513 [Hypsizygus marmoreus]